MAAAMAAPSSSPRARSAAITRRRRASGWFWLSFQAPWRSSTWMRKQTICWMNEAKVSAPSRACHRLRLLALVGHGEIGEEAAHARLIVVEAQGSHGMDGEVVPGRHRIHGIVPGRRNVSVRTAEDRQHPQRVPAPLRVGPRHVAAQHQLAIVLIGQQREMAGERCRSACGDQRGEAVGAHEGEQLGAVALPEGGGDVHGVGLGLGREARRRSWRTPVAAS